MRETRTRARARNAVRRDTVRRQRFLLGAAFALALVYLLVAVYYCFHFMPKSTVNGVDVGGMDLETAREELLAAGDHYALTIKGVDGAKEIVSDPALGLSVTDTANASVALKAQRAFLWIGDIFLNKTYQVELAMSCNESALESKLDGLTCLDESQMKAPSDAFLKELEDGSCTIIPEENGTTVDVQAARQAIREAVHEGKSELSLEPYWVKPQVREGDESLITRRNEWNSFMAAAGLTYKIAGTTEEITGPVIASLLLDDGSHVALSEDAVHHLMAVWVDIHDTYRKSFSFYTHNGDTVEIAPHGDYGFELNEAGTAEDLMARIKAHDTGTYEVKYYHRPPYDDNHGLGGTYIEVSIDDQHVWVWKDYEVVAGSDVVTGLPVHGSHTYQGCYELKDKQRDVTLGTLDLQGYESTVDYWLPFNKAEGLHDAKWRESFGGNIYKNDGSHGCVNVPHDNMAVIFDLAEVGEAVVVYGSGFSGSREEDRAAAYDEAHAGD